MTDFSFRRYWRYWPQAQTEAHMPVFESSEALQAHRVVSQRVRDLQIVQDAAGRVETLLTIPLREPFASEE